MLQSEPPPAQIQQIHLGLELYGGASRIPGLRAFSDQLWAGRELFTPSVAYLRWNGSPETQARVAFGVGDASRGASPLYQQPVEAWVKHRAVTVGRFFTPFAQQEWQYQPKNGLMWEGTGSLRGAGVDLTAALQQDPNTRRGNLYIRLLHRPNENTELGVSLAAGKGLTYGTELDRGLAADASITRGRWQLRSEASTFLGPTHQRFGFLFASAIYSTDYKGIAPFVRYYAAHDKTSAQELGSFATRTAGFMLPLAPGLELETGATLSSKRPLPWLQLQLTLEKRVR